MDNLFTLICMEWLYSFEIIPAIFLRMPQIIGPLGIQPELGCVAE